MPVGEYNFSVRNGDQGGSTSLKLVSEKVASIGYDDLQWRKINSTDSDPKGEISTSMDVSRRNFRYGAHVGAHSGYFTQETQGPSGALVVSSATGSLSSKIEPSLSLFMRRNTFSSEVGNSTNTGVSALFGFLGHLDEVSRRFDIYGLVAGGIGHLDQQWDHASEETHFATNHPVVHVGFGSNYLLGSGMKLGIEYRREAVRIDDQGLGSQTLMGNLVGLTVVY